MESSAKKQNEEAVPAMAALTRSDTTTPSADLVLMQGVLFKQ